MPNAGRIYLDSSVLLGALLEERETGLDRISASAWTSELTELECRRTIDRLRIHDKIADDQVAELLANLTALLKSLYVIRLDSNILKRAKAPFPTVVRSLDAIHLASAELAKVDSFMTLDKQQATAARAIGLNLAL